MRIPTCWLCTQIMTNFLVSLSMAALGADAGGPSAARGGEVGAHRLWKPVADGVYLQEVGEKILTEKPITSVAVYQGKAYVVAGASALREHH